MTISKVSNTAMRSAARAGLVLISIAASLGVTTHWANALTEYEAKVTCPIDGKQFMATMVASFYQQGMRLDTKPLGSVIAPYPFPVCPENGFVVYENDFSVGELAAIKAIVLTDEYRRARSEHTDYYMIAYVEARLGRNSYELGNMYLRASWEAESNKPALVQQYRTLAVEKFDAFVKDETNPGEDWWVASVVATELDRLLGNFGAVNTRLKRLPPALNDNLILVINQIRSHALNHSTIPENFQVPEGNVERF